MFPVELMLIDSVRVLDAIHFPFVHGRNWELNSFVLLLWQMQMRMQTEVQQVMWLVLQQRQRMEVELSRERWWRASQEEGKTTLMR